MSLGAADVKKVARLSRLRVDDDRLEALALELNGIMGWIEQLNEVNIDGVAPMTTAVEQMTPFRDDVVSDGDCVALVTQNAPKALDGFFVVPKVVE